MTDRALITYRGARTETAVEAETSGAMEVGCEVRQQLPAGALIEGTGEQYAALEERGFRVKLLPDTHILRVNDRRIDTRAEAAPAVAKSASEPWIHHLVQLVGPPDERWNQAIEDAGVEVVEPISSYGLFVVGDEAAVRELRDRFDFVAWVGRFPPEDRVHPNLKRAEGRVRFASIGIYPTERLAETRVRIEQLGGRVVRDYPPAGSYHAEYHVLITEVDAEVIADLARLPAVRWLEYAAPEPGLDGERETQIVAANFNGSAPVPGYQTWLASTGLSGAGAVIAICDTGVDHNHANNSAGHVDLRGRQVAFVNYLGSSNPVDRDGHGTHVAGIAVGNAASTQAEAPAPDDFLWGQGMAPAARFVTQNPVDRSIWPPSRWERLTEDAVAHGAQVMNNSWTDGGPAGSGYTANARKFDELLRDPSPDEDGLQYLAIVFSAGNDGPLARTITPPKEAKNPIIVGNSLTHRPGTVPVNNVNGLRRSSSRGPARDGRLLPTVVAPGTSVSSTLSHASGKAPIPGTGQPSPANPTVLRDRYVFETGSSMAAPHVSGCCALLIEWWRDNVSSELPSPALLKALLINGADDLAGGPNGTGGTLAHIPNNDQGWGRVNLANMLAHPGTERGPKVAIDQAHPLTLSGQELLLRVAIADIGRPLRITLAWTDVPGAPNARPALVNDLDLEVVGRSSGDVFKGNVFSNGFSVTGGNFDGLNNVECVYVEQPEAAYEIRVIAASLRANARPPFDPSPWQDFALVVDNAMPAEALADGFIVIG